MDAISVGTKVRMAPYFGGKDIGRPKDEAAEYDGTVIYVNQKGRFYTVEFNLPYGRKLRESFKFDGR